MVTYSVPQQMPKSRHTQAYAELIRCSVTATLYCSSNQSRTLKVEPP